MRFKCFHGGSIRDGNTLKKLSNVPVNTPVKDLKVNKDVNLAGFKAHWAVSALMCNRL